MLLNVQTQPPIEELSDATLMERIHERDESALKILMERKAPQIHSFCTRYLGNREDARDAVQEVFIKVWEQIKKYNKDYAPNTWIYRIATNLCIDMLRSRGSRDKAYQRMIRLVPRDAGKAVSLSHLEQEEVENILKELSAHLSNQQRAVFLLHEVEDMATPAIAEVLHCKQVTVRNHLFHARKIVNEKLKTSYPEYAHER